MGWWGTPEARCCADGLCYPDRWENFYHLLIFRNYDDGVALVSRVPDISFLIQSYAICAFEKRMGHIDVTETQGVRGEYDIATSLMVFKLAIVFELYPPDRSPRRVGVVKIAFAIES
jgi:hypothetical protein